LSNPLQGKGAESGDQGKAGQDGGAAAGRGSRSTGGGLVASGRGDDASAGADGASRSGLGSRGGLGGSRAGGSAGSRRGLLRSGGGLLSGRRLGSRGAGLLGGRRLSRGRARATGGGSSAELLGGGQNLVDGDVSAALLDDAGGGVSLDSVEVLADTGEVAGRALGVLGDGVVEAGQSASGDISARLSLGQSGEGKSSVGELHLVGIKRVGGVY
jgi:hypothetical protein